MIHQFWFKVAEIEKDEKNNASLWLIDWFERVSFANSLMWSLAWLIDWSIRKQPHIPPWAFGLWSRTHQSSPTSGRVAWPPVRFPFHLTRQDLRRRTEIPSPLFDGNLPVDYTVSMWVSERQNRSAPSPMKSDSLDHMDNRRRFCFLAD